MKYIKKAFQRKGIEERQPGSPAGQEGFFRWLLIWQTEQLRQTEKLAANSGRTSIFCLSLIRVEKAVWIEGHGRVWG